MANQTLTKLPNFADYVKSLLPVINRDNIVYDLEVQYESVNANLIPMLELAVSLANTREIPMSQTNTALLKGISPQETNVASALYKLIIDISNQKSAVIDLVKSKVPLKLVMSVVDYQQLNILHYTESLNFVFSYCKRWITHYQYLLLNDQNLSAIKSPVWRADNEYVTSILNQQAFCQAANVVSMPVADFAKSISQLEGHIFNPDDWGIGNNLTTTKLNPKNQSNFGITFNPIYHMGLAYNGWAHRRYEQNKDELARLRLTVEVLKDSKTATNDNDKRERLNKQIEYHNNRINQHITAIDTYEGN